MERKREIKNELKLKKTYSEKLSIVLATRIV